MAEGIGRTLLETITRRGRDIGLHPVMALMVEGNETSVRLYQTVGFQHIGVPKEVGGKMARLLDVHLTRPVISPEFSRVFVIDYSGRGARYNVLDIFHGEEGRDFKVWSIDYGQILLRDAQERLLTAAGFSAVEFYGSYHFEPYDKEASSRLITVARK